MLHGVQDLDRYPVAEQASAVEQVPVIDVAEAFSDSSSNSALRAIEQVADACRTWGFFQVVNHGISRQQIGEVWEQTHALFALPTQDKLAVVRNRENPWGFYNNELTKNQRDKKEVFDFTRPGIDPVYGQQNRWPVRPAGFRPVMEAYLEACTGLALTAGVRRRR